MVSSAVPLALVIVLDDKVPVTPAGKVPTLKFTLELKPFCAITLTVVLKAAPAVRESELTSVLSVKPGIPTTVSNRLILWATVPPVPVTTSLYWPGVTELSAERVSVLDPVPGAGKVVVLKLAVTPVGNPVIDKATGALNPLVSLLTVTASEPAG